MNAPSLLTPEWIDAIAKATAATGALAFFVWKFARGYHNVDLKTLSELQRTQFSELEDCITVTLHLTKGQNGTLVLHDLSARASYDEQSYTKQLAGAYRLSYRTTRQLVPRHAANWELTSKTAPLLKLSPSDEASYSTYFLVPRNVVCVVEYTVLGTRQGSNNWKCQWRGSRTSPPISTDVRS